MHDADREAFPRILIIGSGFAGIGLGIRLRRAGIRSFTILEKAQRLGGTWRENTYPGAACDSPSFAYCFSFEQKLDWSRKWAPQEEILAYLEHCALEYELLPHVRFGMEVESARFDADAGLWRVRTTQGEETTAHVLVSAVGQLNRPHVPEIPGLDSFRGPCFHSARWDPSADLSGKDVAVVGNAASAIQLVPEIARKAATLRVFQRSANWMIPKGDRAFSEREKERFRRFPILARLYRWWIWLAFELRWPVFRNNPWLSRRVEGIALEHLRSQVRDPELQRLLTPDYPIGGKRILISDDYYPALQRENVRLVTAGIERVTPEGLRTRGGELHRVDAIVLATGFETTSFLAPMRIEGPGGRSLDEAWKDGAEAYLGLTVAGFPNFFMLYGPNTNLGHNSIIFMLECQIRYVVDALRKLIRGGLRSLDLRPEVMAAYNDRIQERLRGTVWARTPRSWYKTPSGRITNNWAGTTLEYWWRTHRADLGVYRCEPRRQRAVLQSEAGEPGSASSTLATKRS
jgi:cation diffusion facilitator CzcD-associated flavoprotein CzcO